MADPVQNDRHYRMLRLIQGDDEAGSSSPWDPQPPAKPEPTPPSPQGSLLERIRSILHAHTIKRGP